MVNLTFVDVGVLVDDRDRIHDWVVVQLRFIVVEVELHLGGFPDGAAQLLVEPVRAPLEGVERRVELFQREPQTLSQGSALP